MWLFFCRFKKTTYNIIFSGSAASSFDWVASVMYNTLNNLILYSGTIKPGHDKGT